MDQMVRNDIACNSYRSLELLFGTHTFHFNCFFEDFDCVFTQIRCLSRVLLPMLSHPGCHVRVVQWLYGNARSWLSSDAIVMFK